MPSAVPCMHMPMTSSGCLPSAQVWTCHRVAGDEGFRLGRQTAAAQGLAAPSGFVALRACLWKHAFRVSRYRFGRLPVCQYFPTNSSWASEMTGGGDGHHTMTVHDLARGPPSEGICGRLLLVKPASSDQSKAEVRHRLAEPSFSSYTTGGPPAIWCRMWV
ncbi:hypothetical protein LX36DRAFT_444803 [Colletotrichum falcatum]|nr:hypothetical protein LX36DRAFT_444803 [Colletotrichum falcatum]